MRMISVSWLSLAPFLTSCFAIYLGHGAGPALHDVSESELYIQGEQQPVFAGKSYIPFEHNTPTIYEILAGDPSFTLVTKALNFVEDIASLLNDASSNLTFFAPPDRVLRPPPGSPPHKKLTAIVELLGDDNTDDPFSILQSCNLAEMIPFLDELDAETDLHGTHDDKKNKIAKIILRAILSYHIIPASYDLISLTNNVTYPTLLKIPGAFDGEPLRLRITHTVIPPVTHVNIYTKIVQPNLEATNGLIHVVDHALLPPPSAFQELYMVPRYFSIFTSALQRSNLTADVDLRFAHEGALEGASLVTIFAPTNKAFERLPRRLQLFLFSPFGARALQKLLQYHIVPGAAVHSNYVHGDIVVNNQGASQNYLNVHARVKPPIHSEPVFSNNLTLNSLFENHTLNAYITQRKITLPSFPGHKQPYLVDTKVFVNHQPVAVSDIVSLNGAIHALDRLLDPRMNAHHHHHHQHHHHHHHHHKHDEDEAMIHPHSNHMQGHDHGREHRSGELHDCVHHSQKNNENSLLHCDVELESDSVSDAPPIDGNSLCEEAGMGADVWSDWESWLPQWADEMH